jgi:hypothetical protein
MTDPRAFFLTWRTYGTWLHGDPRGSVDRQHNVYETPLLPASPARRMATQTRMEHPPVTLSTSARELVARVIATHCDIRRWELYVQAVRSNHAHVVVAFAGLGPDAMMSQFKAYATRALRDAGTIGPRAPAWAEGGSTRYLWNAEQVGTACTYVQEGQDEAH